MHFVKNTKWLVRHFSYTPLLATAAALAFLKLLLYAHWMDVSSFGALAKVLVISAIISSIGSGGFHLLANRRVPKMLALGDEVGAMREIMQASVATACFGFLVLFSLTLFSFTEEDISLVTMLFATLHGLTNHVFVVATIESKSRLHLFRFSSANLLRAIAAVGCGAGAAVLYGTVNAVLIGELVGTVIVLSYVSWTIYRYSIPSVEWMRLVRLPRLLHWREAAMVLMTSIVALIGINIDRWSALAVMNVREFGLYAFAWIIMVGAQAVQQIVNSGVFPVVARGVAQRGLRHGLNVTAIGSIAMMLVGVIVAVLGTVYGSEFIEKYYSEYISAVKIVPILFVAAVLRVSDFWTSYLIIIQEERRLLRWQVLAIVAGATVWVAWFDGHRTGLLLFAILAAILASTSYLASMCLAIACTAARHGTEMKP